nr:unnamed protein product [Callosobruchus analis]
MTSLLKRYHEHQTLEEQSYLEVTKSQFQVAT